MDISLEYYRTFYYVAKHRSFTRAAESLMREQPNVTRTIKKLEEAMGCTLFERSSRKVRLTPEGERLFAHVQIAFDQLQTAEQELSAENALTGGVVSIGTSEIALHLTLLPVVKRFRQAYPGIRVRLYNSDNTQAAAALKNRLVDFSLVTTPAFGGDPITVTVLRSFREVPICGEAYAHLTRQTQPLEILTRYPLVGLAKGTKTYTFYNQWFRDHGMTLEPDVETATAQQLLPLIRNDLGLGFVPEDFLAREQDAEGVHILPLEELPPERHVCLLKHKDFPLSIAAQKLEEMLLEERE